MNILFVCRHNRFRSKVAEAIMKKLSGVEVKSAGVRLDLMRPYVAKNVLDIMKKRGYTIDDETSRQVHDEDINWVDKIIIVADNINPKIFPEGQTEQWLIGGADESDKEKIEEIIGEIEKRVMRFQGTKI